MLSSILSLVSLLAAAAALPSTTHLDAVHRDVVKRDGPGYTCPTTAQPVADSNDNGGKGVLLQNADSQTRSFYVYWNSCDLVPLSYIAVPPNQTAFIALPDLFQGRIVRGTDAVNLDGKAHLLGTWLEFTLDKTGKGYADVSLIRGCDGAVTVKALDGTNASTGFQKWLFDNVPADALETKPSGSQAIKATEGAASVIVSAPRDYLAGQLGYGQAYIDDYHGDPVICSSNERFGVTFYPGRP
ncbi:hypothetical protein F5B20DRAFT_591029 [Whalleya microplaca]|nr:hypothetical protein F5B20DRAFT_591029 [Whalleya microplaca]